MKNNTLKAIAKTAKFLAKQDGLTIQRKEDSVYVCESHLIIRMPLDWYNSDFRIVSSRFVSIENGETFVSYSKNTIPEKVTNSFSLVNCYEEALKNNTAILHKSPYMIKDIDSVYGAERVMNILFDESGNPIYLNSELYAFVSPYEDFMICGSPENTSKRPIISNNSDCGYVLCPVNYTDYSGFELTYKAAERSNSYKTA